MNIQIDSTALRIEDRNDVGWKFIAGAMSIWWLFIIVPFIPRKGVKDTIQTVAVLFVVGFVPGLIGTIVPSFKYSWINYILFPIVFFALLIFIIAKTSKKDNKDTSTKKK